MKEVIITVILIIGAILLLNTEMNTESEYYKEFAAKHLTTEANTKITEEIYKSEILECCTYKDEKGKDKSCFVINTNSCKSCESTC